MVGVNITVYDEARKLYEKYFCESKLLLSTMKYFKAHVQNIQPGKDIELSVYCDRDVFSWLLQYTKAGLEGPNAPKLTLSNIIAILVSSNFLQMDMLVTLCAQYISRHLSELILAGTAVASLSDVLLKKVAKEVSEDALEQLWETLVSPRAAHSASAKQHGEFVERLFRLKMDHLLRATNSTALRCAACGALFSASHISQLSCPADSSTSSGVGLHQIDNNWKLRTYVAQLRAEHVTWRGIFWHMWGIVRVLYCFTCHQHFPAHEFNNCQQAQEGEQTCSVHHDVLPIDGCAPVPGVVVDPAVAANCVHCIKHLGCLEIAQRCLQGDDPAADVPLPAVPQSLGNEVSTSDMPADIALLGAGEGDASEDECTHPQVSRVEEKSSPQKYHENKAAACESQRLPAGHQGSLLSCIGNNLLELQDFQVEEESVCDASFRWQLCEEEDVRLLCVRRRMGVLQGFLETLRDAAPPSMVENYMNSPRQPKHGSMRRKSGKTSRCSTAQSTYRKRQDLLFSC